MSEIEVKALELEPCPFCGGKAHLMSGGPLNEYVKCYECGVSTDDGSKERAIAAWNRRSDFDARIRSALVDRKAEPVACITGVSLRTVNHRHYGQDIAVYVEMSDGREIEVIREFGALPDISICHCVTEHGIRAAAMIDAANESEASWKSIWPAMLSASPSPVDSRDALDELEKARAEQWRLRREAEGSRDAARAAADSLRIERDTLRAAIEPFAKLYSEIPEDNFWPSEEYRNLGIAAEAYALSAAPEPVAKRVSLDDALGEWWNAPNQRTPNCAFRAGWNAALSLPENEEDRSKRMSYEISMTPRFNWQVKRGAMVMAVFATRAQAETYAAAKDAAE